MSEMLIAYVVGGVCLLLVIVLGIWANCGPGSDDLHKAQMWCIREEAEIRRLRDANRQAAWRDLRDLERRGILTPTAKYKTLEWLTKDE